ncbi:unnamed protein product, partial [Tilletia controversa]
SGKLCAHMHAARLLATMGSVLQCQVHEQEGVPALRNANLKLSSSTISDAKLDSELEEVLRVLSLHKDTSSASSALPQSETASRST